MDSWKRFNETVLPNKNYFYSNLNMKDITNIDYKRPKNVQKKTEIENLGYYQDLYVQIDASLLADVFETFKINVLKYVH